MLFRAARRADRRQATEARLPADEVGAVPAQLMGGDDELPRKESLVHEVEELPHGVGADRDRGAYLVDEVRRVDGHGTAHPPAVDDDLDRLPAERDLPATGPDRPGPGLHEALHPPHLVVVGDEGAVALRILEELHQPADGRLLGMAMEDDGRHEEEGAADARMPDVAGQPRAERLGERGTLRVWPGLCELADDAGELGEAVVWAFEEVARRREEALGTPGAVEHGALGEAVQAERPVNPVESDLDAGLPR